MNPYKRFIDLIPRERVDVGTIVDTHADGVTVQLETGSLVRVRGSGALNDRVYIRAGAVEGPAPALPSHVIEV